MYTNRSISRKFSVLFNAVMILSLLISALALPASVHATGVYTMTDLGTLGGSSSQAVAINEVGQIIGYSYTTGGQQHAFVWQGGVMTDLGTLGGSTSVATAINQAGQVLGYSYTAGGQQHAFVWQGGVMTDLGTLNGGSGDSSPQAINEAGQVTGQASTVSGQRHAFVWDNGAMTDLGTLGGIDSYAVAINEAGQVIGYSYLAGNTERHAFVWDGGVMIDLGTFGGGYSYVGAINGAGQVVGWAYPASGQQHAFMWEGGIMTDLGTLGTNSQASAINEAGQVIGSSGIGPGQHGFIWHGGVMTDLGTFGGNNSEAVAINEAGQVIGRAYITGNTGQHAFIWDNGVMTDLGTFDGSSSSQAADINETGQVVGYSTIAGNSSSHAFVWDSGVMTDLGTLGGSSSQAIAINEAGQVIGNSDLEGNAQHHAFMAMAESTITDQTITVITHAPASAIIGSNFTVAATASSGLPVSYSSSGTCTNAGADFTMISGSGDCTVMYDQVGDANYNPAPQVIETVTATPAPSVRYVATTGTDTGDCGSSSSSCATITYAISQAVAGNTIEIATGTYTEAGITVDKDLTLIGAGAVSTIVQAATDVNLATNRVFLINNGVTATIESMTIQNGKNLGGGAGILNNGGSLTLNDSIVSHNLSVSGGGISSNGTLVLNHSIVTNNSASRKGAGRGGGILGSGTITLNNSTVSGNGTDRYGGGIYNSGTITLNNSTVSGNKADSEGGGFYNSNSGTIILNSSIVAGNKKGLNGVNDLTADCSNLQGGTLTSQGYNLTGSGTGCDLLGSTGDVTVDPTTVFIDVLGVLANNGGPTQTHALIVSLSNPALNAIPNGTNDCGIAPFNLDQRGEARPFNNNCDMGAYEAQSMPPTTTPLTITADNQAKTYGDSDPASFTFTYSGFVNGDDETVIDTPPNCAISVAHDNVDTYPITCSGGVDDSYTFNYVDGTLTVTQKSLTITADNQSKVFGNAFTFLGTEFTTSGLIFGDTVTSVTLTSLGAPASASMGTYPIVPSAAVGTGLNNYAITYVNGLLTIGTNILTITANDQAKTYGDVLTFAGTEFTVVGLLPGHSVTSVTLTSAGAPSAADVGAYPVVPSGAIGTGLGNYTIIYTSGQMDVNSRNLTFNPNNQTKIYGDMFTAYTGTFTGLRPGDTITPIYDSAGSLAIAAVSTYPITVTLDDPDNKLSNYNVTIDPLPTATLIVTPKDLIITPDNQTKTYGDVFTTFTGSIAGIQNGDIITATYTSLGAPATKAVDIYPITVTLNAPSVVLGNYNVIMNSGSLTVTRRDLVVSPDDKTKVYGDFFTAFTGAIMGLQPGDNITANYASSGAPVSATVGSYPITATLNDPGNKLGNYNVTLNTGTLIVDYSMLTVTADDKTVTYGDPDPAFTLTYSGFAAGDTSAVINTPPTCTVAVSHTNIGTYPIVCSGGVDNNYIFNYMAGALTVLSSVPDLLAPANAEQLLNNQPTFDWTDVSGALSYTIQISNNIGFSGSPTSNTVTLSTYTQPTNLPANVTRYWRVQATTGAGAGPWSVIRSFVTASPPSAPTLAAPVNNSLTTDYTPLIDWNNSSVTAGTTFLKYELQIATDSAFTSLTSVDVSGLVTNSDYTPSVDLDSNATYYWRVRAYNTLGQYSAWSAIRNFRTALLPPTLVTPIEAEQMLVNRPTFEWDDVTGATGYRIQIANNIGFSPTLTNTVVTPSTYTRTTDLPFGATLYWRVQSNGTNGSSAWSEVHSLITTNPPSVPTLASPANNAKVSGPSPLFDWNDSTLPAGVDFDYYQIQVAIDNGFITIVHDNNVAGIANSQDITAILPPATTYYWRVRAFNTVGHASAWSTVRSVRIKFAGPTLAQPGTGSTVSNLVPIFIWDAVNGAADYTIQVSKNNTFTPLAINQTAIGPTYTHTTALQAGTTYYWRVRVKTPTTYGAGDWSQVFTFTTP